MNRSRPNILFLFPDTHRGDWMPFAHDVLEKMGLPTPPIKMPHIEQLMAEGVTSELQ